MEAEAATAASLLRLLEVAALVGERTAVVQLLGWLGPLAGLYEPLEGVTVGRIMGEGAVLLGEYEAARQYYAQGQAVAAKLEHRPELALLQLDLAELGASEGHVEAAQEHLAFCIPELEAMKMRPALERARALRSQLGG